MRTEGIKELLEEMLDGKFLSWFSVWVKFFDNFFHGLFFDFVKGPPVRFLNLLHIFVRVRHNFNLTPFRKNAQQLPNWFYLIKRNIKKKKGKGEQQIFFLPTFISKMDRALSLHVVLQQ